MGTDRRESHTVSPEFSRADGVARDTAVLYGTRIPISGQADSRDPFDLTFRYVGDVHISLMIIYPEPLQMLHNYLILLTFIWSLIRMMDSQTTLWQTWWPLFPNSKCPIKVQYSGMNCLRWFCFTVNRVHVCSGLLGLFSDNLFWVQNDLVTGILRSNLKLLLGNSMLVICTIVFVSVEQMLKSLIIEYSTWLLPSSLCES